MHSVEINGVVPGVAHEEGPLMNGAAVQDISSQKAGSSWKPDRDDDDFAVLALRNLLFDICNPHGGHGGSAIGMSAIGVALYKYIMHYNPLDSEWFDRDRFVLSNGESSRCSTLLRECCGY
jgi:dihydroxyacetone synthase